MKESSSCEIPRWSLLKAQLNNLDSITFKAKMETGNALIIDVRKAEEFMEGHIKNAIQIDYFEEQFWEKIKKIDPSKDILVYCRSGRRSIRVCTLMKNGGFDSTKIFNLDGGYLDWLQHFPE